MNNKIIQTQLGFPSPRSMSPDESTPLLCDYEGQKKSQQYAPLPKAQFGSLCLARLVEPIAFTQIFPYVNELMNDLHVTEDPSRIGFYSGLVLSAFPLAQLFSIYPWSRLSDKIGRRPITLIGTLGISLSLILLGLTKSFTVVLFSRCLAGLFSGDVAVMLSALGEMTDSTNQHIAFPLYGLLWPIGVIFGPLLGGSFSHPEREFPRLFDHGFFREYPYFMPCFLSAVFGMVTVVFAYFSLNETLPRKRQRTEKRPSSIYTIVDDDLALPPPTKEPSVKSLLSIPIIFALSACGCVMSFIATSFDAVFVLFCYSPVESGGLALPSSQIGYALTAAGVLSALIQAFCMPSLLRRFDNAKMYNFCMKLWPITFVALPLLNFIALGGLNRNTEEENPEVTVMLWVGLAIVLIVSRIGSLAYALSMILVKENSSPSSLGATNGLVSFVMCFSRAASPAFVSSLFAVSRDNHLLGGHLWVLVMFFVCTLGWYLSWRIVQIKEQEAKN